MCLPKTPRIPKTVQPQEVQAPEPTSFFDDTQRQRGLSQGQGFTGGIGNALQQNQATGSRKLGE